jgi:signal transduction histidine kinase
LDWVRSALQAGQHAARVSRRLLSFAAGTNGQPEIITVGETVDLVVASLDDGFLNGVEVELKLEPSVRVRIDRDQFTQILLNLLRNSREAMPNGGKLCVKLATVSAADQNDSNAIRNFALLTVGDTGVGMNAETSRRIFEPFFTTKNSKSGGARGLGMSMVHTAVTNAGGFLNVSSTPGSGTTVEIHFPIAKATNGAVVQTTHSQSPA